jgi:type II secretory pathway pseudopilin PulG
MIAMAIIGILASILFVITGDSRAKGRDARRLEDMRQIEYALALFFSDHNHYPGRSIEGVSLSGEMIGDDEGPIERALAPYMSGTKLPKDPRHDGRIYFYSYDPVHCVSPTLVRGTCRCPTGAKSGATLAFNRAENAKTRYGIRKETWADGNMNHCNADYVAAFTPASP